MSNIAGSSVYSTANTSTSTLRPRNNRLISYLDETSSDNDASTKTTTSTNSRGVSPSTTPRYRNVAQPLERSNGQSPTPTGEGSSGRRSSSLWDSWSSIQGVASSLLSGGEGSTPISRKGSLKTPAWMKQDPKFKTATATPEWGPKVKDSSIADPGSIEERQAVVQAKRREALLLSCTQQGKDGLGHFKRKTSYDADPDTRPSEYDLEQDALVYKHLVQPRDTLAGVTIKYSCQPEAFRKVNRFWPNDNIQTRTYVLLPVEACGLRGKKLDDVSSLELLTTRLNNLELDSKKASFLSRSKGSPDVPFSPSPELASPRHLSKDEEDYQHDSFVILPSFSEPVEILRIPRRMLGYFPRTRRKSNNTQPGSVASTPKTSFDMLRHPPTHAAQQAAAALHSASHSQSTSLNTSPVSRPKLALSSRQRSSSITSTTATNSANAWILKGPGGVGTLSGLRSEISRPGPASDSLNQKFAQYFPSLALPSESGDNGNGTNRPSQSRTASMSRSPYRSTPRASTDSIRSTRSNSSTFGAGVTGVENFMRKLATNKRPDMMPRSSSGNLTNAMGLPIGGETGLGDLIELETNPDALHHGQAARRNERLERTSQDAFEDDDATPTELVGNQDDLLDSRFPVRGRITRAYIGDDG